MIYGLAVDAVPREPVLDSHPVCAGVVLLGGYELPPSFKHVWVGGRGMDVDIVDGRLKPGVWDDDVQGGDRDGASDEEPCFVFRECALQVVVVHFYEAGDTLRGVRWFVE